MKTIIVALSLLGMAYAGGYGLDTLSSLSYGGLSDGGYGGYGRYGGLELDDGYKGSQVIVVKDDGYGRGYDDYRGYGDIRGYGRLDGDDGLDHGGDIRYGKYSPMPRPQIKLVGVPVPVKKPYPVPVDRPYTVKIDKPYPVKVERIEKQPYVAKVIRPVIEKTIHIEESRHH